MKRDVEAAHSRGEEVLLVFGEMRTVDVGVLEERSSIVGTGEERSELGEDAVAIRQGLGDQPEEGVDLDNAAKVVDIEMLKSFEKQFGRKGRDSSRRLAVNTTAGGVVMTSCLGDGHDARNK